MTCSYTILASGRVCNSNESDADLSCIALHCIASGGLVICCDHDDQNSAVG